MYHIEDYVLDRQIDLCCTQIWNVLHLSLLWEITHFSINSFHKPFSTDLSSAPKPYFSVDREIEPWKTTLYNGQKKQGFYLWKNLIFCQKPSNWIFFNLKQKQKVQFSAEPFQFSAIWGQKFKMFQFTDESVLLFHFAARFFVKNRHFLWIFLFGWKPNFPLKKKVLMENFWALLLNSQ